MTAVKATAVLEISNNEAGAMVGDILTSTWGYEQTNYDYYEVIKTTAKTVTLKKLYTQEWEGEVILKNKRAREFGNGYAVSINSFANAYFKYDDRTGSKTLARQAEDEANPYRSRH